MTLFRFLPLLVAALLATQAQAQTSSPASPRSPASAAWIDDSPPSPRPGWSPEVAAKLAGMAVTIFQQQQIKLDYSPESLRQVDALILKWRAEGNTAESMQKTLLILGCYVGEVMVRNLPGARWDHPTEKERALVLGDLPMGMRTLPSGFSNPMGKVFKRMANGEEDSVFFFYEVFGRRAAELQTTPISSAKPAATAASKAR
ncbi:DUF6278 family protein [Roseateles sp. UC29_93]|uniref:DUF6278 family protein n=1 Tax=Roseateles sp. UC29_93 TaxID=3350177 RepID=UPI00366CABC5